MTALYLNHDADFDWLIALEFGRVADGQPPECWRPVTDAFAYLDDGRPLGFCVNGFSELDPNELDALWQPPRFDAPVLGLRAAAAGEIVLAAQAFLQGESTLNRPIFDAATAADDPHEALEHWTACLQAGDAMAHYGLGYTLHALGRFHESYGHLRHYAEIAPHDSWNLCWLGKAAEAIGELGEARAAYERAVALEREGDEQTEASERLAALASAG
jgi:tetratricopeptide (TPR) repeat protein